LQRKRETFESFQLRQTVTMAHPKYDSCDEINPSALKGSVN